MKYISLNKKSDSDHPRTVFRVNSYDTELIERLVISKSNKYNGCSNCDLAWLATSDCPSYNGELSLSKAIESIDKITPDFIDFPPYCISISRARYHKSLFVISLIKNLWKR